MSDQPVTRYELERAREEAIRVATLEAARVADEAAHRRIAAAVDAVVTNVTQQIGMTEKTTAAKIDGLKWRMIAALLGGQTLAGVVATLLATRTTPVEAGRAALAAFTYLL